MTTLMTFDLESPETNKSISVPPRPSSHEKKMAASNIVRDNIQKRILTPSVFEWASAIALVTKSNGIDRLYVNYKLLNQVTKAPVYPLPHVQQALDKGASIFSRLIH